MLPDLRVVDSKPLPDANQSSPPKQPGPAQFDPDAFMAGRGHPSKADGKPGKDSGWADVPNAAGQIGNQKVKDDFTPATPDDWFARNAPRVVAKASPGFGETDQIAKPAQMLTHGDIFDVLAREQHAREIAYLGGMLFLPPALGYVLIFHVLRWVYRGFRAAG